MTTRKLKVISDGTSFGTFVVDAETGQDLRLPITKIGWQLDARHPSTIAVTFTAEFVELEIVGAFEESLIEEFILRLNRILATRRSIRGDDEASPDHD